MLTNDEIVTLFTLGASPWLSSFQAEPPTFDSVNHINQALGIKLPDSFIQFATACPHYVVWFASIGDDFDSPLHIVRLNELFHAPSGDVADYLPPWLVMFNYGHDGDCDCFDSRVLQESGEHPLFYYSVSLSSPQRQPFEPRPLNQTFHDYLEELATRMAHDYKTSRRRNRNRTNA